MLAFDTDQRDTDENGDEHHCRHDVAGPRVERIGRNKQIDEVKRAALFDERGAETRRPALLQSFCFAEFYRNAIASEDELAALNRRHQVYSHTIKIFHPGAGAPAGS